MKLFSRSTLLTCFAVGFCTIAAAQNPDDPFAPDEAGTREPDGGIHVTIHVDKNTEAAKLEKVLEAIGKSGVTSVKIEGAHSETGEPADHPVLQKLSEIVIPSIEFLNTPLEDGLDFLRFRARELDGHPDPNSRGVNLVLLPKAGSESLTLKLSNIRLGEALAIVGRLTERRVSVTDSAVVFAPEDKPFMTGSIPLPDPDPKVTMKTKEKLKAIIVPSIDFVKTPLADALAFLRQRSVEIDSTADPSDRGVNVVFKRPDSRMADREPLPDDPLVTLNLGNIPLGEALRFSAEAAGMKMEVRGAVVLISLK